MCGSGLGGGFDLAPGADGTAVELFAESMPRPSGFTDAELAAAAWRRNLKNKQDGNQEDTEVCLNI